MNKTRRRQLSYSINTTSSNPLVEPLLARGGGLNRCALRFQSTALIQWKVENGKLKIFTCHFTLDAKTQEQTHLFTPVMLNLFQHLTSLACNLFADKILKLSWIIRDLAGVTSRSTLRARLHRCPTENPRVQDDSIRNFCNEPFNYSTVYITPSQPSPSREGAEVIQCKTWRTAPC